VQQRLRDRRRGTRSTLSLAQNAPPVRRGSTARVFAGPAVRCSKRHVLPVPPRYACALPLFTTLGTLKAGPHKELLNCGECVQGGEEKTSGLCGAEASLLFGDPARRIFSCSFSETLRRDTSARHESKLTKTRTASLIAVLQLPSCSTPRVQLAGPFFFTDPGSLIAVLQLPSCSTPRRTMRG
jgi:hypothetical protein